MSPVGLSSPRPGTVLEVWGEAGAGGGDVRGEDRATAVGHGAVLGSEGWAVRGGRVWVGTRQGSGRGQAGAVLKDAVMGGNGVEILQSQVGTASGEGQKEALAVTSGAQFPRR